MEYGSNHSGEPSIIFNKKDNILFSPGPNCLFYLILLDFSEYYKHLLIQGINRIEFFSPMLIRI